MSERNVEVVQAGFERFPGDDWFDLLAPDILWEVRPDLPDAGIYRGREGVREVVGRFEEVMEEIWIRPVELIPVGSDRVVVPLNWGGTGRASGIAFEERSETWVFTVRDDKIARVTEFASREQALEATGAG